MAPIHSHGQSAFEFLLLATGAVLFVILAVSVVRTAINTNSNAVNNTAGGYQNFVGIRSERVLYSNDVKAACTAGYAFSEGSGTSTADAKGNSANNGTLISGPTWATGKYGNGLSFNGSGEYVNLTSALGNFGTSDFSIAFWAKETTGGIVFTKRTSCSDSNFIEIRVTTVIKAELDQDGSGTNYNLVNGVAAMNDGAWHHVVITRVGPTVSLYRDGVLDKTQSGAGTTSLSNSIVSSMGGNSPCSYVFNGNLDEIALYNRSLTADEISGMYTAKEFWCG